MNDLISREEACLALDRIKIDFKHETFYSFYQKALMALHDLPSARSEIRTQMPSANCISRQKAIDAVDAEMKLVLNDLPPAQPEIIRCKECKWFGDLGCAIRIVDDSDKPTENDYCSFAERKSE